MIETIFATGPLTEWPEQLERLSGGRRRDPFDQAAIAFVAAISSEILRSPVVRSFPELAALAHWFRPSQIRRMHQENVHAAGAHAIRPRGSVFIIAPANVDILFIYGWLLSILCGNVTIVRVSQKKSEAREIFLNLVRSLADGHRDALADSLIVSYPHDHAATRTLSSWCDLRLIWGGDNTIRTIRAITLKPTAVEGAFADRFSMAAFDAEGIVAQSDAAITQLAHRFANDTMWFGQQACSSPRLVFWIGPKELVETAQKRFWTFFSAAAARFDDEPAAMMSRIADLFVMAAHGAIDRVAGAVTDMPARGQGETPVEGIRHFHSGFGLFVEYRIGALSDIGAFLVDKDQTLVVACVSDAEIARLVERLPNRSLDRIVPVGQATEFAANWDGIDLLDLLTRRVAVPRSARRLMETACDAN